MKVPSLSGLIRRRVLLNYRADPEVVVPRLPGNFRPKLFQGKAIVGICLIRLEQVRPAWLPPWLGFNSENAATRIAVEWEDNNRTHEGVFVPRRDTNSRLNHWAGGRIFPGVHHLSRFEVFDSGDQISLRIDAGDWHTPLVSLRARPADKIASGSIFRDLEQASTFFSSGCVGYSGRDGSCMLDGLRLAIDDWSVAPLDVVSMESAYFDDRVRFPAGSIEFDHALLMRNVPHRWESLPELEATPAREAVIREPA